MRTQQKTFDFEPIQDDPALLFPAYWRDQGSKGEHDGISPREGFLRLNELLEAGHDIEDIYPHIQKWGTPRELTFGKRVLEKIGVGVASIDRIQQENANKFRTALKSMTNADILWWWYELHVSRNLDMKRIASRFGKGDRIFIDKAHAELGRFREEIRDKYEEIMQN